MQQTLGYRLIEIACNMHGTVDATILHTTAQNIFTKFTLSYTKSLQLLGTTPDPLLGLDPTGEVSQTLLVHAA